jgi:hypothetical protein
MFREPRDEKTAVVDGMGVQGEYCDGQGQHNAFSAVLPESTARFEFIKMIYQLATDVLQDPESLRILENIFCYLGLGLPVKDLGGNPRCIRFFGGISTAYQRALARCLGSLPKRKSLLIDMSDFEGMGTLLYPVFRRFVRRRRLARTAWWASLPARQQLQAIGVRSSDIFDTRQDALQALQSRPE